MRLLIFMFITTCSGNLQPAFLEKVLSDFKRNSNFIALNIASEEYTGVVVIENDDLYRYLKKEENMTEAQFQVKIAKTILTSDTLIIASKNIENDGFMRVFPDIDIENQAKQGISDFIKTHFDKRVIKGDNEDNNLPLIIKLLFAHEYSTRIDDESGYLILDKQAE